MIIDTLKKLIITILILAFGGIIRSQPKHDRNWCFGIGAGINFNNPSDPLVFDTKSNNSEVATSISDENGNLQLYLTANGDFYMPSSVIDSSGTIIINGDSINTDFSCTNCALFIPSIFDHYILFHIGYYQISGCPYSACYHLYYSKIRKNFQGIFEVYEKNIPILEESIEEKLSAVRHANGKDWWILIHQLGDGNLASCTNRFYTFLITEDSISGPFNQDLGTLHCSTGSFAGEMTFSRSGNKLAISINHQMDIDIFNFDRCQGLLYNYKTIGDMLIDPYGCEFSPNGNLLYISEGGWAGGDLYQFNLNSSNVPGTKIKIWDNSNAFLICGQLQLGPDERIYLTTFDHIPPYYNQACQNLSVIGSPDSSGLNCAFTPFSFYLGDSARSLYSLPNMPNYNPGPTPVYTADAGSDTVYCSNSTSGVMIGVPLVENIIYSWSPSLHLSNTTIAQPTASPMKDTWYYLTVTDTSAITSCTTRTDSVFVKVENCTGISSPPSKAFDYKLIPNLFNGNKVATVTLGEQEEGYVEIYNVTGTNVLNHKVSEGNNTLNLNVLPKGVFIYKVLVNGELKNNDKLVILE